MPRRKLAKDVSEDTFETDAFSFMNQDDSPDKTQQDDTLANTSTADSDLDDGDDSDEAPEDVGFSESRQSVMNEIRSALKQVDSERKKKKDMRRKMDEQFKEQKAKKLEHLAKSTLPSDVLESIEDSIPAKRARPDKAKKKKKNKSDGSEEDPEPEQEQEPVNTVKKFDDDDDTEDFIAFTDTKSGVQVADTRAVEKQRKSTAQAAADFRQSRLYGSHLNRQSNKDRLAIMDKRRQRFR